MRKFKFGKKFAASAAALAMIATSSAASVASMTAFAGELLGEGTFNEGAGLPWHICENGTAEMAFEINNGVYAIQIKNPGGQSNGGEDRWDCQFRHRGISLTYGHTYRLTYAIYATDTSSIDHIEAKGYNLYLIEANYNTDEELREKIKEDEEQGQFSYYKRVLETHLSQLQAINWLDQNKNEDSEYCFIHQHITREEEKNYE